MANRQIAANSKGAAAEHPKYTDIAQKCKRFFWLMPREVMRTLPRDSFPKTGCGSKIGDGNPPNVPASGANQLGCCQHLHCTVFAPDCKAHFQKNIPTGANPMGCTIGRAGHHNRQCRGAKSRDRVSFSGAGHPCNVYCTGFAPDCKQQKAPAGEVSSQRGGERGRMGRNREPGKMAGKMKKTRGNPGVPPKKRRRTGGDFS